MIGQGDGDGPKKYAKARMMLQGEAATAFEAQVDSVNNHSMTNPSYKQAINAVTETVFPKKAAQIQKRYLH